MEKLDWELILFIALFHYTLQLLLYMVKKLWKDLKETKNRNKENKITTNKEDENIYSKGITDSEFRKLIITYLLGNDWYVADPIAQNQVNEIALFEILCKYLNKKKLNKILNKPYKNFIKGEYKNMNNEEQTEEFKKDREFILEVLKRITPDTSWYGETNTDNKSLKNIDILEEMIYFLLDELFINSTVPAGNKGNYSYEAIAKRKQEVINYIKEEYLK